MHLGFALNHSLSATHAQRMRGLALLLNRMSKALATHAKSFPTKSATSHSRPRWVYIAHTQRLAVGSKVLEKSGLAVVPPAKGRNYREHANGYKTSRCRNKRNNRQHIRGTSASTGSSAQSMAVLPLSQSEQHMLTNSAKDQTTSPLENPYRSTTSVLPSCGSSAYTTPELPCHSISPTHGLDTDG